MEEERFCEHSVIVYRPGFVLEEDKLYIKLQFFKQSGWHRQRSDPVFWDYRTKVAQRNLCFNFTNFKRQYETEMVRKSLISDNLKDMGVPEDQYDGIIQELFDVIKAAVSPEKVIVVEVLDVTRRVGVVPSWPRLIPTTTATSSLFIQSLEQVSEIDTKTTCCICLEDSEEQEPLTSLPCKHHFHVQCIVQWLEISHLCPLCRYAMPTVDRD